MKKIIAIAGSPLSAQISGELKKQNIEVVEDFEPNKEGVYTKELSRILDEDNVFKYVNPYGELTKKQKESPLTEPIRSTPKIQNNEPCICGSGKKYKKCCKY